MLNISLQVKPYIIQSHRGFDIWFNGTEYRIRIGNKFIRSTRLVCIVEIINQLRDLQEWMFLSLVESIKVVFPSANLNNFVC